MKLVNLLTIGLCCLIFSHQAQSQCSEFRQRDSVALRQFYSNLSSVGNLNWDFNLPLEQIDPNRIKLDDQGCQVKYLNLEASSFSYASGSFPTPLLQLSGLQVLNLSSNGIQDEIPYELYDLRELQVIDLSYNGGLRGGIADQIEKLSNLRVLQMSGNKLSGLFPKSICKLASLEELSLTRNEFYGTLPTELGQLSNLKYLRLGFNKFSGAIPVEIANLTQLNTLSLPSNGFTGDLPAAVANMPFLENIILFNNFLEKMPSFEYLRTYQVENNLLSFEDVLPMYTKHHHPNCDFTFTPQKKFKLTKTIQVEPGETVRFDLPFDKAVANNLYDWRNQNGDFLSNTGDFTIKYNNKVHKGLVSAKITNPELAELSLEVEHFRLECAPRVRYLDTAICENAFFDIHNVRFDAAHVRDTIYLEGMGIQGCDSVIIVHVDLRKFIEHRSSAEVCYGQFFEWNQQLYHTPGTYIQRFASSNGCDSIVYLQLNVLNKMEDYAEIKASQITPGFVDIKLNMAYGKKPYTYDWNTGIKESELVNVRPGYYKVKVTDANLCTAEFIYDLRTWTGTTDLAERPFYLLSPQPANHYVVLKFLSGSRHSGNTEICILQGEGRLVRKIVTDTHQFQEGFHIDTEDLASGIYYLSIKSEGNIATMYRLVISH
ncbi:MAG: hypothetical protein IPQ10_07845 [Saprospiraceae bacterium]|nr:hypothetical protein [Saprospiraceae bacterium]MBL0260964.1 hypothetical protein [Saprospiraceae bacterium]